MASEQIQQVAVWTLRHKTQGNVINVTLPTNQTPADADWELEGEVVEFIEVRTHGG